MMILMMKTIMTMPHNISLMVAARRAEEEPTPPLPKKNTSWWERKNRISWARVFESIVHPQIFIDFNPQVKVDIDRFQRGGAGTCSVTVSVRNILSVKMAAVHALRGSTTKQ